MKKFVCYLALGLLCVLIVLALASKCFRSKTIEDVIGENWNSVTLGMSQEQVASIMGPPTSSPSVEALRESDYICASSTASAMCWKLKDDVLLAEFDEKSTLIVRSPQQVRLESLVAAPDPLERFLAWFQQ
jgi:outer membrane protein assembly factor BamE (lipoprotein component of BamABCDE complex)